MTPSRSSDVAFLPSFGRVDRLTDADRNDADYQTWRAASLAFPAAGERVAEVVRPRCRLISPPQYILPWKQTIG